MCDFVLSIFESVCCRGEREREREVGINWLSFMQFSFGSQCVIDNDG